MKIILSNEIQIIEAPEPLVRKIRDTFTIENPRWIDNDRMSRWNGETDHWLTFYKNHPGGLSIPRGAMGLILYLLQGNGHSVSDHRPAPDIAGGGLHLHRNPEGVSAVRHDGHPEP